MTAEQWFADEQNIVGLREALANPFLQEAFEVVAGESRPNYKESEAIATARVAADAAFALSCVHLQQAGMNRALDRLKQLSRPRKPVMQPSDAAPYDHIQA